MKIDAHQHFWNYNADTYNWIDDSMKAIQQNFLPEHLLPLLLENNIDGCIAVQSEQTLGDTNFLLALANKNSFIKGVVGWINLQDPFIGTLLEQYATNKLLKGFRHILQAENNLFMLQPAFQNGIQKLQQYNFTYDILIKANQLAAAIELVKSHPNQKFIVNHIAKPNIKIQEITTWQKHIQQIAAYPNVYCKISGMVTEADYNNWTFSQLLPYIDAVVEAFGTNRIVFGTDWPVCLVAASYKTIVTNMQQYFTTFSENEQQNFWGNNAIDFYNIQ